MIPEKIIEQLSGEWIIQKSDENTLSNGPRILQFSDNIVTALIYNGNDDIKEGTLDEDHKKAMDICISVLDELNKDLPARVTIPNILTPDCFVNHPGPEAILFAAMKTHPDNIFHRKGPFGKELAYVKGYYINTVLNFAFQYRSSFVIDEMFREGDEVICIGHTKFPFSDGICEEHQCGSAKIKFYTEDDGYGGKQPKLDEGGNKIPISIGNAYKAAATDCKKKCAAEKDIARDVYIGDV